MTPPKSPLNVFITIDTEVWPGRKETWKSTLSEDIQRDIYGETNDGNFGVTYQADVLNAHGLKAVFMVEALFACAAGLPRLQEIVSLIQQQGQEVQLHLHTEWLARTNGSVLPGRTGQNLKDFSLDEQATLVCRGLQNLKNSGARKVCAFRAGNCGVNFDTLLALQRNGVLYDTSHNLCYLWDRRGLKTEEPLLQPRKFDSVYEFPVACFHDFKGQHRPVQPSAVSSQELESALLEAWKRGWYAFVLTSHSFELLQMCEKPRRALGADRFVIKRWERLCRFLDTNRDKFRTTVFSEIDPASIPSLHPPAPLTVPGRHTAVRFVEQLVRRVAGAATRAEVVS